MILTYKNNDMLMVESVAGHKGPAESLCEQFGEDFKIQNSVYGYFSDGSRYFNEEQPENFIDNMQQTSYNVFLRFPSLLQINLDDKYMMNKLKAYFNVEDKEVCEELVKTDFSLFDIWCRKYDDAFARRLIASYDLEEVKKYKEELSKKGLWMQKMDRLLCFESDAKRNTEVMELIKTYKEKIGN